MVDYQHKLYLAVTNGKLGRAPVQHPRTVLDVATGTGIWAQQYGKARHPVRPLQISSNAIAESHPTTRVIGSDLSLIQHPHKLPNLRYVQHDAENDRWSFPIRFDYVHLRYVVTCFSDTQKVIREAYRNLNPGGWLELYDAMPRLVSVDGTLEGTAIDEWNRRVIDGGQKLGRDLTKPTKYAQWCRDAGFVDVTEEPVALPSHAWPRDPKLKKLGALNVRNQTCLVDTLTKLMDREGLSDVQAADLERRAKEDVRNPNIHFVAEL